MLVQSTYGQRIAPILSIRTLQRLYVGLPRAQGCNSELAESASQPGCSVGRCDESERIGSESAQGCVIRHNITDKVEMAMWPAVCRRSR